MDRIAAKILLSIFLTLASSKQVFAYDLYSTGSAVVSATIPSVTFNSPILISPNDNSVTNNNRTALVWQRPSPLPSTPLHHYDVYLDGQLFATSVSDSISSQTYYFYTIRRDGSTFYLEPSTNFTEGYHTWSVTAYDTYGTNSSSETRTFYIDSVSPFIRLEKVDRQTLNWDTSISDSIPDINQRDLTIYTSNPLLKGKVEAFSNMQITLICPQNIPTCTNQTWQGNYPTGIWQHRFYNLQRGQIYTVHISSIDAGGNSTFFPEFYLAYGIITPTPSVSVTATIEPSIPPTPEITETPSPIPTIITPTPTIEPPLISPTPPIEGTLVKKPVSLISTSWFLLILIIGLPLHLIMTIIGAKVDLANSLKFIFILLFPFLGKKKYQTVPFATIKMYNPEKLDKAWQSKISDINGYYSLTSQLIEKIFVKISLTNRKWNNVIINSAILPITCLIPLLQDSKNTSDRFRMILMRTRWIPLLVACLTSAYALSQQPNYFYLIYLYLSLQLSFSEYIYPKITK